MRATQRTRRAGSAGTRIRMHVLASAIGAVGAVVLLSGCSSGGVEPTQVPITQVDVGDCFDTDAEYTTALIYPDCSSPHLYEAFFIEELSGDAFPGDEAVAEQANAVCDEQFHVFTGVPVSQSTEYFSLFMGPTERSWMTEGDRTIVCIAMPVSGQPREGSAGATT